MREDLESLKVVELRELAQSLNIPSISGKRKADLIEYIRNHRQEALKEQRHADADDVTGYFEQIEDKDYGFLRSANFESEPTDVYVSPVLIRKMNLTTGDMVQGKAKRNNEVTQMRMQVELLRNFLYVAGRR